MRRRLDALGPEEPTGFMPPDESVRPSPQFEMGSLDFSLDGVRFKVAHENPEMLTDESGVALAKPWSFVEQELRALSGLSVSRMLEIGVREGGSAILWTLLFPVERYVGVDLRPLEINLPLAVTAHPRWQHVRLYGKVSQDDRDAIGRIISTEFDAHLDLIIDDASHQYELSRRTFEICFPKLREGGVYLIEDWAWAHNEGPWRNPAHPWHDKPSLANLVLRLVLLAATRPDIVSKMTLQRQFVIAVRGQARLDETFDIELAATSPRRLTEVI
jgi:hypothetical protein